MIARPARVRIRSRKPWVLDRRRLFGWNVRLLTRYSHYMTSAVARLPADRRARGTGGAAATAPGDPRKLVAAGQPARTDNRAGHRSGPQTPTSIAEETDLPSDRAIPDRSGEHRTPPTAVGARRDGAHRPCTDAPGKAPASLPGCGQAC